MFWSRLLWSYFGARPFLEVMGKLCWYLPRCVAVLAVNRFVMMSPEPYLSIPRAFRAVTAMLVSRRTLLDASLASLASSPLQAPGVTPVLCVRWV